MEHNLPFLAIKNSNCDLDFLLVPVQSLNVVPILLQVAFPDWFY